MSASFTPIPKEETYRLIALAKEGDEEAKETLIVQNSGLVKKLAHKFSSPETEYEDFVQIGYVGLMKAVYKFDPGYDVMFSTYAVPIILGEMRQFFRDNGRIKAGRGVKNQISIMKKIRDDYLTETGQSIRVGQLAEAMNTTVEQVLDIISAETALTGMVSLDNPEINSGEKDNISGGFEETQIDNMAVKLEIEKLPERQRAVIGLRYYRDMTQTEVSHILGISQVQVSRIEKKAIENIKACFYNDAAFKNMRK